MLEAIVKPTVRLYQGDCLDVFRTIDSESVDAVITDPPYPEIDRPYGRMTEADWHTLMRGVVAECRRILKPTGSAVFILQPNSERVGRMRPWLWEFMAWTCREWNMVQDAWWWNCTALPLTKNDPNTLRASVKACVWLGHPDCYHDASGIRWVESDGNRAMRNEQRAFGRHDKNAGTRVNVKYERIRTASVANGGVTPFNLLPFGSERDDSSHHDARTPRRLADWWTRYISPPNGVVCDPFVGAGTMGLAAIDLGRSFIGIERDPGYFATASKRIDHANNTLF